MKTNKKSKFLTFCFSLLPGAAEMYMGFMKMGVSLMLLFFAMVMMAAWLNQGLIVMLAIVVWFYGFFHANHLAGLADEDFANVKDEYLFGMDTLPGVSELVKKHQKWVAVFLIFIGICFFWSSMAGLLYDVLPNAYSFIPRAMWKVGNYIPSFVIAIVIVVAGVKLIGGKKVSTPDEQEENNE